MNTQLQQVNDVQNPFTPGFGQIPPILAGRSRMISDIERALQGNSFSPDLTTLFVGARGSGKTAMLSYVCERAEAQGWIAVNVSAVRGMLDDILEEVRYKAGHLVDAAAEHQLKGVSLGGMLGMEWENPERQRGNWRTQMNLLFDQLEESGTGLLISIDEVQPKLDEMILLASVYQHFVRERRRVGLMLAGLPSKISALLSNDSVSFFRRAQYRKLGRIADYEVSDALQRTIEFNGRRIAPDALKAAVAAIGGFPYMLQLVGYRAWDRSPMREELSIEDVEAGVGLAREEIREKILQTTYAELSAGDLRFVNAMLEAQGDPTLAEVSERLGKPSNYASKYKARLIEQGVIGTTPRNTLRFELPMFEAYAREMMS